MKKKKLITLAAVAALALGVIAGCGKSDSTAQGQTGEKKELETIKVGAAITPHAEILNFVKEDLAEQGYNLEVVEYNDYVLPNTALEAGDLDANYFQHKPYLDDFNKEKGTHIVIAGNVHFEPLGIYAGKTASLDALKEGATVAVPNDTTNEARALLLLEQEGLIKLKEGAGLQATKLDIAENPLNLQIQELEAAQVARAVGDVDIAAINGNYALQAGLGDSALAFESAESGAAEIYPNFIAVKEGNENTDKTKALVNAVQTDKVKKFIEEQYKGAIISVF